MLRIVNCNEVKKSNFSVERQTLVDFKVIIILKIVQQLWQKNIRFEKQIVTLLFYF